MQMTSSHHSFCQINDKLTNNPQGKVFLGVLIAAHETMCHVFKSEAARWLFVNWDSISWFTLLSEIRSHYIAEAGLELAK